MDTPKADQYHFGCGARLRPFLDRQSVASPRFNRAKADSDFSDGLLGDLLSVLESIRFLELSPERMREPSVPGPVAMGDSGENLPIGAGINL